MTAEARVLLQALRRAGVTVTWDPAGGFSVAGDDALELPSVVPALTKCRDAIEALLLAEHVTADPRPDLLDDTHHWRSVLAWGLENRDHEDLGTLRGLRCFGAQIASSGDIDPRVVARELLDTWSRVEAASLTEAVGSLTWSPLCAPDDRDASGMVGGDADARAQTVAGRARDMEQYEAVAGGARR